MPPMPARRSPFRAPSRPCAGQRGYSLVEVSIVTAIVLLIAIAGIPAINGYVIENKVPRVGEELQRFVARMKANAQGAGTAPYRDVDTGILANALRSSSIVAVDGSGASAVVAHGLGGAGTAGSGAMALSPAAVGDGGPGSGFALTLQDVNDAACPALASVMQRVSDVISVAGRGGAVTVKDALAEPPVPYDPILADAQCAEGDRNTFVFTVR